MSGPGPGGAASEPVLRVEGLSYRYPGASADALRAIDLEIGAGELVVLAGRSGCGKSTLLRAACGLVPHFHGGEVAGRIEVAGRDVRDHGPGELADAVGFVAQEPETQVVATTVETEIELPLELRGVPVAQRARAVEEVALALAISGLLGRPTDSLSGGELQRVALAATLAPAPALLLLDEPTCQLDPVAGGELIAVVRRLNEEHGVAVLACEHRLERLLPAADRVIALADGELAFEGRPRDYLRWALAADPDLATAAARLLASAGLSPPPVSVREARRAVSAARPKGPARAEPARAEPADAEPADAEPAHAEPSLRAAGLEVEVGEGPRRRRAVRGIDLELRRGERVALIGRNGAGKTTLLRALAGLLEPARGRVVAAGGVALVPQRADDMLVRERVGDELPGAPGLEALTALGLERMVEHDPRDLSGGERQRLAIALAIAGRNGGRPLAALLLDEPTRGMDGARKRELGAIATGFADRGSAVMIATHDVEFAATFADRVVLLGDGTTIADGPAAELLAGGLYFSTEVARITGGAAITAAAGAELLSGGPQAAWA